MDYKQHQTSTSKITFNSFIILPNVDVPSHDHQDEFRSHSDQIMFWTTLKYPWTSLTLYFNIRPTQNKHLPETCPRLRDSYLDRVSRKNILSQGKDASNLPGV